MKDTSDIYDFNRLYHDYKKRFTHFAKTYVDNLAVAEDIVIDSLMYYWENRTSLENKSNIPAYILTIIKKINALIIYIVNVSGKRWKNTFPIKKNGS